MRETKRSLANAKWHSMLDRCLNPKHPRYSTYGGRGITVCERWLSFEAFLEDMGLPCRGLFLDRIENNKGYYKENCRWATPSESAFNRRNKNALGETGIVKIDNEGRKRPFRLMGRVNGKRRLIGYYATFEEAKAAKQELATRQNV